MKAATRRAIATLVIAPILLVAPTVLANPMDITLNRFVTDDTCGSVGGDYCLSDGQAFRDISRELGFALAPLVLAPPETLGYSGFYVGLEGQITMISNKEEYWKKGTEEMKPSGALFLSALHIRKGLPGSLELGTTFGYLAATEQVVLGLDIKFSPLQGLRQKMRKWIPFPDLAIRGTVHQLIGEDELNLTMVGIDASLSYPFTLMHQATLTPYFAYQFLWIIADSEVVDGTPGRNFAYECGTDLGPACLGDPTDSNNLLDFERQYIHINRLMVGLRLIYEYLAFTVQYSMGLPANKQDKDNNAAVMHQISFGVGADF
jgi:hypothetical protein